MLVLLTLLRENRVSNRKSEKEGDKKRRRQRQKISDLNTCTVKEPEKKKRKAYVLAYIEMVMGRDKRKSLDG